LLLTGRLACGIHADCDDAGDIVDRAALLHGGGMIDLNTATAKELDAVPQLKGHGFEIVRYRDERGRFDALRQLDEVPGLTGKWDGAEAQLRVD
jgi:competence protein ComEA